MKLHKTCGACGTHTHVRSKSIVDNKCPACGTAYPIIEKTKRVPTQEETAKVGAGAGWKTCPDCEKSTKGARSLRCVHCDRTFDQENEVDEVESEELPEVVIHPDGYEYPDRVKNRMCAAPAGPCPFRLRSNNENVLPAEGAIRAWAHKVRQTELTKGTYLTNKALLYWARQEVNADLRFGRQSEEMEYLRSVINTVPDIKFKRIAV